MTISPGCLPCFRENLPSAAIGWVSYPNRNGLTPESMKIKGFAGWFVRSFYNRDSVLKKSFRNQTVDVVAKQVKTCGGWVVVTSADSQIQTLID